MKKKLIISLVLILLILLGFIVYNFIYSKDIQIPLSGSNEETGNITEDCPITSSKETSQCYASLAIKQKDYSICEKLPDSVRSWGLNCYIELAVKQNDRKICELINNITGWENHSITDQCLDMVEKGEVIPLLVNDLGELAYITDELNSVELQARSLIRKQLTFIKNTDYSIGSLKINNFYPDKLEYAQMGFGGYPNTVSVNCLNISSLQIHNSEEISGWISTDYCLSDEDLNILKGRSDFKMTFGHFLVSLQLRGKHNSLIPEVESLMINNLENQWENLKESNWPSLERISPLDIYTFNSDYYETSKLNSTSFYNTTQKSNRNNFFVINTNYESYLDGRVFVYNDIDLKSINLSDLSSFYRTVEGYGNVEEIDCEECGYKGYFLSKQSLNSILGESGAERLTLQCDNKIVYIFNNIIFEIPVTERQLNLTLNSCGNKNIEDCVNDFQCLSEEQRSLMIKESKNLMDFIIIPFEEEKITLRDISIEINGVNYLYDYSNSKRTDLNVSCLKNDDCEIVIAPPCQTPYSIGINNKQTDIDLFIENTNNYWQGTKVDCGELNSKPIPLCKNNICSYGIEKILKKNEECGNDLGICGAGLICVYPCGIPGCTKQCLPENWPPIPSSVGVNTQQIVADNTIILEKGAVCELFEGVTTGTCAKGLVCYYPCGIPGCDSICVTEGEANGPLRP